MPSARAISSIDMVRNVNCQNASKSSPHIRRSASITHERSHQLTWFDAFWQFTFRTMSIDEIARAEGISRQGMTKRIARCRRLVRESLDAERLLQWFAQQ